MGFISDLVKAAPTKETFIDRERGERLWRQTFATNKEEKPKPHSRPIPGGSHGRSSLSSPLAYTRLLEAMRSMAPGGWSDDRYEQTRHLTGMPYVAITRIGMQLAGAEFQVFKRDPQAPEGRRPVTEDDPPEGDRLCKPYDLVNLLQKPNRQDSFGMMMWRRFQQKALTGTALTWMVPNKLGVPMELYIIPTAIAIPQPAVNPDFPDGYYRIQPLYPYGPFSSYPTPTTAVGAPIPAQWMLRSVYPHPLLRYDGYSPLTGMRLHIDETEMMDRSRFYKMKRSINPSAVVNFTDMEGSQPLPEEEIERIHAEWENEFQGPENAGKLIVGVPGGTVEEFGTRPVDMEYQAGWEQLTSFVLGGGFGITKPAAGMIEDSSYGSLFATIKQLNLVTLDPECDMMGSELTKHLAPFFGDDLIVEVRCKKINDHEISFAKVQHGLNAKCLTKNQVLQLLELPTTKEEWGNDIAGDPSPMEKQAQQQEQQMGAPGGLGALPGVPGGGGQLPEEMRKEPLEAQRARETPGPLAAGSRNPLKSLREQYHKRLKVIAPKPKSKVKTIYQELQEVCTNGHEW